MSGCGNRKWVDAHFSGRIAASDELALRQHLPSCADCRRYYDLRLTLASIDPWALGAVERIGRGLGVKPRRNWLPLPALALATACVAVFLWIRPASHTLEPQPRGAATCELTIYRVHAGSAEPSPTVMAPTDELAFSYRNGCQKKRLLVFAIDEAQHIFWYHPGWVNESENPTAIGIASDGSPHELTAAVRQPLEAGALKIRAVFSNEELSVRQAEEIIRAGKPFAEAATSERVVEVRGK